MGGATGAGAFPETFPDAAGGGCGCVGAIGGIGAAPCPATEVGMTGRGKIADSGGWGIMHLPGGDLLDPPSQLFTHSDVRRDSSTDSSGGGGGGCDTAKGDIDEMSRDSELPLSGVHEVLELPRGDFFLVLVPVATAQCGGGGKIGCG